MEGDEIKTVEIDLEDLESEEEQIIDHLLLSVSDGVNKNFGQKLITYDGDKVSGPAWVLKEFGKIFKKFGSRMTTLGDSLIKDTE